jgi:hypothetical protein
LTRFRFAIASGSRPAVGRLHPEIVQGVSELEVGRDYRFVVGARAQIFIPENAAYHR